MELIMIRRVFKCQVKTCRRQFYSKYDLYDHVFMNHPKIRLFACCLAWCPFKSMTQEFLLDHLRFFHGMSMELALACANAINLRHGPPPPAHQQVPTRHYPIAATPQVANYHHLRGRVVVIGQGVQPPLNPQAVFRPITRQHTTRS